MRKPRAECSETDKERSSAIKILVESQKKKEKKGRDGDRERVGNTEGHAAVLLLADDRVVLVQHGNGHPEDPLRPRMAGGGGSRPDTNILQVKYIALSIEV